MVEPKGHYPRATLRDVARRAGVSHTTASFVLSGRTDMRISTRTSDTVRQAARELDYRPRVGGRVTLIERRPAIGVISDTIASGSFGGELIRGSMAEAARHGLTVVVAETGGSPGLEAGLVQELLDGGVERFLYATTATREVRLPASLRSHRTILVNCVARGWHGPAIVPDERTAGILAARTLVDAGHRSGIWLVGDLSGRYAGRDRWTGISTHLARHGLEIAHQVDCAWWPPDAREAMAAELGAGGRPTAVIAMNDRVAMGVYQAAKEAGLQIPRDLSVVSFDNSDLAWWLAPGLTSIGLPYFDMGRRAIELVLGAEPSGPVEQLPMPIFDRGSVAAPAT